MARLTKFLSLFCSKILFVCVVALHPMQSISFEPASTKQKIKCLVQGHNMMSASGEAETSDPLMSN